MYLYDKHVTDYIPVSRI